MVRTGHGRGRWVLAAAALSTLASCSYSGHAAGTPIASSAAVTVTAAPATALTYASRLVAHLSIDNPDGLVEVGGAIWVKTDDGRVVRIDPLRNKVTGSVKVDTAKERSHYCQGIGTDGTAVWACAASDSGTGIVRIDPKSLMVGRTIEVKKVFVQLTLPHTTRGVWVLTGTGNTVTVVDPSSGARTSYPLGTECQQLAASEALLVATCPKDGLLLALDPTTGAIRGRVRVSQPGVVALARDEIWVDTSKGLIALDEHLNVRAIFPHQGDGSDEDLAATGDVVWVRARGGVLWRIDTVRKAVTEMVTPSPAVSAGSLLITSDGIWVSGGNEGIVFRLSR